MTAMNSYSWKQWSQNELVAPTIDASSSLCLSHSNNLWQSSEEEAMSWWGLWWGPPAPTFWDHCLKVSSWLLHSTVGQNPKFLAKTLNLNYFVVRFHTRRFSESLISNLKSDFPKTKWRLQNGGQFSKISVRFAWNLIYEGFLGCWFQIWSQIFQKKMAATKWRTLFENFCQICMKLDIRRFLELLISNLKSDFPKTKWRLQNGGHFLKISVRFE